jgi:uncharacterized protein (TIGR02646 family)
MISVKKDYNNPPEGLNTKACQNQIKKALIEKDNHNFSSYYYRDATYEVLKNQIYHRKCGYCETDTTAGAALQVDHYRPKKHLQDDSSHSGYYWLAYEWSNLILVCSACNSKKSNQFPLELAGKRVTQPPLDCNGLDKNACQADSAIMAAEKPLLLNPEIDKPESHFIFLPNGEVIEKTQRGKKTKEICDLNRDDLVIARKAIVDNFLAEIRYDLNEFKNKRIDKNTLQHSLKKIFSKIFQSSYRTKPYSRLAWFMFHKFEIFFVKPLEKKQQQIVKQAFQLFKEGKL